MGRRKKTREEKFEEGRAFPVGERTQSNGWWEPDCQGKGSFDGSHVRFDTRYWLSDLTAACSVELMFKGEGEGEVLIEGWIDGTHSLPYLQGKSVTLVETDGYIRAETFAELRHKVEGWHETQRKRVEKALRAEFNK